MWRTRGTYLIQSNPLEERKKMVEERQLVEDTRGKIFGIFAFGQLLRSRMIVCRKMVTLAAQKVFTSSESQGSSKFTTSF